MSSSIPNVCVRQMSCAGPRGVLVLLLWLTAVLSGCAGAPKAPRSIELVEQLTGQTGLDRSGLRVIIEIPEEGGPTFRLWGTVESVGRGYLGVVSLIMDVDGKKVSIATGTTGKHMLGTSALPTGQLVRSESFYGYPEVSEFLTVTEGPFTIIRFRAVGEFGSSAWFEVTDARKQELREALAKAYPRRGLK